MPTLFACLRRSAAALLFALPALAGPPAVAPLPPDPHPLRFTPNQRQWAAPVLFAAEVPAGRLYLERDRLLLARYDARVADELHHRPGSRQARIPAHAYEVRFVGANAQPAVTGEAATGERSNYFLGNDESRWATNVPAYAGVRYQQLYPGVDLRFYAQGRQLEYDFELAAGAEAGRIKLRYTGQQSLRVVAGALQIGTSVGQVTEQRPVAYQVVDGRRVAVPCHYVLGPQRTVSFGLPQGYDHARPLVIDPVLVYSTYSGATAQNWGYTACPDTLGNLYAASTNFAVGYPTTLGAYDTSFGGGATDITISKYNPNAANGASSLLYATYLGGSGADYPHSLVVNRAGELLLLGSSESANVTNSFPTTAGAYDRSFNGKVDLVLAKLSASGNQLLAATFLGGSDDDGRMPDLASNPLYKNFGDDYRGDIITDAQNNVYLASVSQSANFPATGGYQTTRRGTQDAVVCQLSPTLSALSWSTYLGGTGVDAAYSIQLDPQVAGGVFVGGGTSSTNFPGTAGGLNAGYGGGPADGFVAHLAPGGAALVQSTYLGTSSYDQAYFVQLDRLGAVYVLGQTNGAYPITAGTYRNANSRQFIHKLSYGLNATAYSTVFGNGAGSVSSANPYPVNLAPTAFLVDNCGQLLLSGYGASSIAGMPTTADALQATATNSSNGTTALAINANTFGYLYVMQLSANARRLVYGTYFGTGSTHVDGGTSRFDKKGIIYQAICVRGLPGGGPAPAVATTANALARAQANAQTSSAAFKMDIAPLDARFTPAANGVANARSGCAPLTVSFSRPNAGPNGTRWDFGNGQTSTQPNNVSTVYATPGTYTVRLTAYDSLSCQPSAVATTTITVLGLPRAALGPDKTICPGGAGAVLAVANPEASTTYTWAPPAGLSAATGPSVTATPAATTTYYLTATAPGGCIGRDTVVVTVANLPGAGLMFQAYPTQALVGEQVSFGINGPLSTAITTLSWDLGDGSTGRGLSLSHAYAAPGTYTVRLLATGQAGCQLVFSVVITVTAPIRDEAHPNIITPNGDGKNDTFQPYVMAGPVRLQVFSRWGQVVFEQENYQGTWGANAAPGVYFYRLSAADGQSWKGWVEVR